MKVPAHERHTLDNGVKLILIPRHDVPLIAFEAVVRGGASQVARTHAGMASLTAELLTRGAGDRDAFEFADAVEGVGGSFEADAHCEAMLLHGQFLAKDRELMMQLLTDALQRPHLAAEEFDTVRSRRIEFIKAAKDGEPQSLIGAYGRSMLFAQHPYGAAVGGSEATLAALQRRHLPEFYQGQFGPDRLTLVFAGDFDPDALREAVNRSFGKWRVTPTPLDSLQAPPAVRGRRVMLIDAPNSTQSYFWIANVGVSRSYEDRAALDVTNTAFGGSFGSMLVQALRVKTGLTYSAGSSFRRGSVAGEFAISSFTQTASTAAAIEIALQTLATLKCEGLSDAAIASARSYILGQYPLSLETSADWAGALAELDLFGLPCSHINEYAPQLMAVDAAQSRRVVDTAFPSTDDLDIVVIGDAARIREQVAAFGPVTEKPLEAPDFS
jgi:zinc protease